MRWRRDRSGLLTWSRFLRVCAAAVPVLLPAASGQGGVLGWAGSKVSGLAHPRPDTQRLDPMPPRPVLRPMRTGQRRYGTMRSSAPLRPRTATTGRIGRSSPFGAERGVPRVGASVGIGRASASGGDPSTLGGAVGGSARDAWPYGATKSRYRDSSGSVAAGPRVLRLLPPPVGSPIATTTTAATPHLGPARSPSTMRSICSDVGQGWKPSNIRSYSVDAVRQSSAGDLPNLKAIWKRLPTVPIHRQPVSDGVSVRTVRLPAPALKARRRQRHASPTQTYRRCQEQVASSCPT